MERRSLWCTSGTATCPRTTRLNRCGLRGPVGLELNVEEFSLHEAAAESVQDSCPSEAQENKLLFRSAGPHARVLSGMWIQTKPAANSPKSAAGAAKTRQNRHWGIKLIKNVCKNTSDGVCVAVLGCSPHDGAISSREMSGHQHPLSRNQEGPAGSGQARSCGEVLPGST